MKIPHFNCLLVITGACWLALAPAARAANSVTVTSPDGNVAITAAIKSNPGPYPEGRRVYYRVSYKGQPVLKDSPLGISFTGAAPLNHNLKIVDASRQSHDQYWHWAFGAENRIRNHYNQATVLLREVAPPRRRLDVILRAYNTGVAIRYRLPRQPGLGKFIISGENTGFYFAGPATAYALYLNPFEPNYEGEFRRINLDQVLPETVICLPLTIHLQSGPWVSLLEADLTNYAGLYVSGARKVPDGLKATLAPPPNHNDLVVKGQTPMATPWRVLLISSNAAGLIQASDPMMLNLNQPSVLGDTSWIHAGKSAWNWWSGSYAKDVNFKPGMNTATMEHYIAFAARAHLPYMLIDAGWSPTDDITHWVPQVNLPAILKYAKQRNVKILLWDYGPTALKQMDKAFPLYEKWGVAGVKVDFMYGVRQDQANVNQYRKLITTAARYHLVIDIHGAYAPTGIRRTYPNLLTREAVMGLEYDKWSYRQTPRHAVTLPFTRMLAGPMDYTPGCFNNAARAAFRPRSVKPMCQGTRANQLAMYVVYLSPLEMLSDYPADYIGHPGFQFLEKVPTVWDQTKVLNGEPGRFVTIARRNGKKWYLGSMTNWQPRELDVHLSFLGSGRYQAQIFADGPDADQNAKSLTIKKEDVSAGSTLHLKLASGGGAAVIFSPIS